MANSGDAYSNQSGRQATHHLLKQIVFCLLHSSRGVFVPQPQFPLWLMHTVRQRQVLHNLLLSCESTSRLSVGAASRRQSY